jgi:uncharacterized protein
MVTISRFAHVYELDDAVALYHSLRMKPVYLTLKMYKNLQAWLASSYCNNYNEAPETIRNEVLELQKFKILTQTQGEDERVLQYVKSKIPSPAINVCYIILSEQCNLACKYCFLGNNDTNKRSKFISENMSADTAYKSVDFFVRQIKSSGLDTDQNKPILIFYGGEPLVNFSTLERIARRINELRQKEKCIENLEMSVITNGVLLNERMIKRLNELKVSIAISVDGVTEEANNMRVDTRGRPVFARILTTLDKCKELSVDVSLSVTLSEAAIKDIHNILNLIDTYDVKAFGFNIMMSDEKFVLPQRYNESAAQFIIDAFVELRERGVYEDRMMRKLKAFSKAQVYFSDCAATAGGQIVISPDGSVGICHGCLSDKMYFISHIDDETFTATNDKYFIEWSQLTPLNHEECLPCPALGICGGGCPVNAMHLKSGNTIHSIDERFCVHSKKTLDFFIRDLYRIIVESRKTNV